MNLSRFNGIAILISTVVIHNVLGQALSNICPCTDSHCSASTNIAVIQNILTLSWLILTSAISYLCRIIIHTHPQLQNRLTLPDEHPKKPKIKNQKSSIINPLSSSH